VLILGAGCSTYDTLRDSGYTGPRVYSGARQALSLAKSAFLRVNPPEFALWVSDSLLSSVADTLLLPFTIPQQSRMNAAVVESQRLDVEQPGVLPKIANEEPQRTARRLFQMCNSLLVNFDAHLTDCYSIHAKIEITADDKPGGEAETLDGAEYKKRLRSEFASLAGTERFIRLRNAKFEEALPNVRVTAERADQKTEKKGSLVWVVGPGEDGEWRILEEQGAGFP
jgi:hypothetical protein